MGWRDFFKRDIQTLGDLNQPGSIKSEIPEPAADESVEETQEQPQELVIEKRAAKPVESVSEAQALGAQRLETAMQSTRHARESVGRFFRRGAEYALGAPELVGLGKRKTVEKARHIKDSAVGGIEKRWDASTDYLSTKVKNPTLDKLGAISEKIDEHYTGALNSFAGKIGLRTENMPPQEIKQSILGLEDGEQAQALGQLYTEGNLAKVYRNFSDIVRSRIEQYRNDRKETVRRKLDELVIQPGQEDPTKLTASEFMSRINAGEKQEISPSGKMYVEIGQKPVKMQVEEIQKASGPVKMSARELMRLFADAEKRGVPISGELRVQIGEDSPEEEALLQAA